jgi:hypothetical protein
VHGFAVHRPGAPDAHFFTQTKGRKNTLIAGFGEQDCVRGNAD